MKQGNLQLNKSLEILVIDEADFILSFGYEDEVKELLRFLPKIYHAILPSTTLSDDVKCLKRNQICRLSVKCHIQFTFTVYKLK